MSDTPRTDEANEASDGLRRTVDRLERELAEARAERDTHKKSLDMLYGERFPDRNYRALKSRAELAEAECERLREDAEMKLPCGVTLDRGTHIGKGCSMSTLVLALKNRARYEEEDSIDAARKP